MRGDKLVIHEGHRRAASQIAPIVLPLIEKSERRFTITIAGESGGGKSEIAAVLAEHLEEHGVKCVILQQDDYFVYPPKTNARMREKDIGHVGLSEVHLNVMDNNLSDIQSGKDMIDKPLVIFEEDKVIQEEQNLGDVKVAIAEGTYTTSLRNVDQKVFIDRTYIDTKEARARRAREKQDDFLEQILKIEHEIISSHKPMADIIVTKDYNAEKYDAKVQ